MSITKNLNVKGSYNKGITLIALVITIIILLILAGISIAMLTGDNEVLTKASDSKTQTEITEIIERARVDILGVQAEDNDGKITETELNDVLVKYDKDGEIREDKEEKYIITENDYEIKVSDIWQGEFAKEEFKPEKLSIGTAQNTEKYGWKVKNYEVKKDETGGWRLFYQDDNCTYIISNNPIGIYRPSEYYANYPNGASVSIIGQRLNPIISSLFTETNTNKNIRTTAWLTDTSETSMWNVYKNDDALFAIRMSTTRIIFKIM